MLDFQTQFLFRTNRHDGRRTLPCSCMKVSVSFLGKRITDTLPEAIARRWCGFNCRVNERCIFQVIIVKNSNRRKPFACSCMKVSMSFLGKRIRDTLLEAIARHWHGCNGRVKERYIFQVMSVRNSDIRKFLFLEAKFSSPDQVFEQKDVGRSLY